MRLLANRPALAAIEALRKDAGVLAGCAFREYLLCQGNIPTISKSFVNSHASALSGSRTG
jgi:hypothetical protein